jgi:hypothetical protein
MFAEKHPGDNCDRPRETKEKKRVVETQAKRRREQTGIRPSSNGEVIVDSVLLQHHVWA